MHAQTIVLIAVTFTAAVTDATRGKVYNWLTYPAAVAGLFLSVVAAPPSPRESVVGLGLGLLLFGVLRRIGKMGAGDVKLWHSRCDRTTAAHNDDVAGLDATFGCGVVHALGVLETNRLPAEMRLLHR